MTLRTSIVIPAYNESARLADGYARLAPALEALGRDETEVVVVDDGSTDDTLNVTQLVFGELAHLRVVQQPQNRGKGAAVRLGIAVASAPLVIVADADMSIRPEHFPAIVAALHEAPLAPGSRADAGRGTYDSLLRTVAGRVFNLLVRHYTGTHLRDTQCGCKGFQLGPARVLGLLGFYDRFAYDAEMFFLAAQLDLAVTPVPVTWDDVSGSSVRVARDSLQMLRDIRGLRRTRYENPSVTLPADVDVADVARLAREARLVGVALARGANDTILVLPRDGALGGAGIAAALAGRLGTVTPAQLRGRTFQAV